MYPTDAEFVSPHPFVILNFLRTFSLKDSFSINRGFFFFCFGTGVSLTLLMTAVFKKPSAGGEIKSHFRNSGQYQVLPKEILKPMAIRAGARQQITQRT